MTKGAKGAPPPTKSDMSSPVKAGGKTIKKLSPSPAQKKKDERNKKNCQSDPSKWYMLWLGILQFLCCQGRAQKPL